MTTEGTFQFTITGTLRTDSATVRTALMPMVEAVLRETLREQGVEPVDDGVAIDLSSEVMAQALAEMANDTPEGLVGALLERAFVEDLQRRVPSSEVLGTSVEVHRTD